jgi:hypothetical protein
VILAIVALVYFLSQPLGLKIPFDFYTGTETWVGIDNNEIPITSSNYARSVSIVYRVYNIKNMEIGGGLSTWQLTAIFDETKAQFMEASIPDDNIFAGKLTVPILPSAPVADHAGVRLNFLPCGCAVLDDGSVIGSGVLCVIEFKLIGQVGTTARFFFSVYKSETWHANEDTFLLDEAMNEIPFQYDPDEGVVPEFSTTIILLLLPLTLVMAIYLKKKNAFSVGNSPPH